jgi:5-methylcytosine-specific restriction endonuclease McrA
MALVTRSNSVARPSGKALRAPEWWEAWRRADTEAHERFACDCQETTLRFREKGGRRQFFRQCRRCGGWGDALRRADLSPRELALALPLGADAWREWQRQREDYRAEVYQRTKEQRSAAWWSRYEEYLQSPEWAARRTKVLARDGGLCQACLERRATQAHHLTYERVFDEPLFDLIAICEACHLRLHSRERDREERG